MERIKKQELHEIFEKLRQGDKDRLNELYKKYNKLIYGIAFSILKNKEDSEDLVQIVFLKIFKIDKSKLPKKNESSWLYSLTKNETLNYLKKKTKDLNIDEIYNIAEEDKELNKIIDNDEYNKIISKLNEQEQEIVSLKILSKLSFKEISLLLNLPMGTVQWKYYTSLYTLRFLLGNISMVIIGILLYIKGNVENKKINESNIENGQNLVINETSEEQELSKNEISSSVENGTTITIDSIMQNETIEIQEPQQNNDNVNISIGLLGFTSFFLVFTLIIAIIGLKHKSRMHKKSTK